MRWGSSILKFMGRNPPILGDEGGRTERAGLYWGLGMAFKVHPLMTHFCRVSTASLSSANTWGPSVQTHMPMRDILQPQQGIWLNN